MAYILNLKAMTVTDTTTGATAKVVQEPPPFEPDGSLPIGKGRSPTAPKRGDVLGAVLLALYLVGVFVLWWYLSGCGPIWSDTAACLGAGPW